MKTVRSVVCGSLWLSMLALPSAQAMAADGWGSSWSFGPVHPTTSNHIIYTKTTIVPGRLPPITSTTGPLFLWPGLSNPTSDLIQTTMDAWPSNANYCGAAAGQWCVEASVFGSFGQRNGPNAAIDPDDHVTIEYKLGSDNNTWTQTVTSQKLGKVVSTLTSTSGLMPGGGVGFATEADANSYTIDTQYYLCTEVHLAVADPAFGATGVGGIGAKMGATGTGSGVGTIKNLHTPDGGLTWLADLITLPAMNPQGTQTPVPAYSCGTGGTGGTSGTGGSSGSGGSTGKAGNSGSGGTGSGGSAGKSGGTGSGGTTGKGGSSGGNVGTGGSTGKGGNSGSGGSGGGAATAGTTGTTGGAGSGGATGAGGLNGAGGATQGSGGSVVAGTGGAPGGSDTGGATGTGAAAGSPGTTDGASGCDCVVGGRAPRGGMFAFLLLGAFALRVRRRRNRT